LWILLNSLSR